MKNKEFINISNEKELMEIEREAMKSMQEGYGHEHEEYLAPEENEVDIVLRYTKEENEEYQAGRIDLNREAEMASRNILAKSNSEMMEKNKDIKDGKFKYTRVKHLPPKAVAELIIANKEIIIRKIKIPTIRMGEEEQYIPAVRMKDGLFRYLMKGGDNMFLNSLIRRYNPNASKQFISEVYACIQDSDVVEKVNPTLDENVVPMGNGAWDYAVWEKTHDRSKAFISNTDPEYDRYTFMTKVDTDYNPDAESPVIQYPDGSGFWEVMAWIDGLLNGDGQHPLRTQLLLEIIHSAVRVFTCFGRGVWFIDESRYSKGGQGKGTFCDLIRHLLGVNHCKDTEVYHLEDPKKLSGLESCNAIIADEASHHYIKHGANYKRLQRGEPVSVKTLYKDEYTVVFKGLLLQCLNEPLTFAERTGSVERTRVVLTWKTSYTDRASGVKEQRCIKQDFVRRPEVLQYLLKYMLEEMNITEFSEECLAEVEENLQVIRNKTNAVAQFMNEHEEEFVWDRLPFTFLFDAFVVWYTDTHCQKPQYKLTAFIEDVALWADTSKLFEFHPKSFRPCHFMSAPEPLTRKLGLGYPWVKEDSLQRHYGRGERPLADCVPAYDKNTTYKEGGLFRKGTKGTSTYNGQDWDESGYAKDHPAVVQYVEGEYVDGKRVNHALHPIRIQKKFFMIHEAEECFHLAPVNKADMQGGSWPLEIDKGRFIIHCTQTELWLTPYTRVIDEECQPIRDAIASVAGDGKEDAGENQDRQE